MHNNQQHQAHSQLSENLENGDLAMLLDTSITIDEYKSKMGSDDEIIVVAFTIQNKDAAQDLTGFIERSYDWILDADNSPGELDSGKYLVFVEINREPEAIDNIMIMMQDLENLVHIKPEEYTVVYNKPRKQGKLDKESLKSMIPTTPEEYRNMQRRLKTDIDNLKAAAGVKIDTRAPVNDFTESLRIAAGIR